MNTAEEHPIRLTNFASARVVNGCLQVNGRPFVVENIEGTLLDVRGGWLEVRTPKGVRRVALGEVAGSWA